MHVAHDNKNAQPPFLSSKLKDYITLHNKCAYCKGDKVEDTMVYNIV